MFDILLLFNELVVVGEKIEVQYVYGYWCGVNDLEDFCCVGDFVYGQMLLFELGVGNGGV